MFERKIPFFIRMRDIAFQYALEKMTLMHDLNLPDKDMIIGGIAMASLRATATTLVMNTVEEFIEKMRIVTEASTEAEKRLQIFQRNKWKEQVCRNCSKRGHQAKDCKEEKKQQSQPLTCYLCKAMRYLRPDFPLLQKKKAAGRVQPKATVSAVTSHEEEQEQRTEIAEPTETVATILEGRNLLINSSPVKIIKFDNKDCLLCALMTTCSPVSFIKASVYSKFCDKNSNNMNKSTRKFQALNNLPIVTCGVIHSNLVMEQFPSNQFHIELNVLKDDTFHYYIIIDRDFLTQEKLTLIYKSCINADEKENEFLLQIQIPEASKLRVKVRKDSD